ncbi:hypothetical protein OEB99_05475 [Actinotalea sp. M2MS4P-6]|uniref:SRPBCC family protein n=1 Tax=Actinotalea sp. M2MS4P-6 TaxID=2983762 RepID=UPI0021E48D75|nr:SRPBCC family protein [Actinotalea sp. M2MS4P-6]MCV2393753.1 hypothetical protein [Actinotalea sp. M2MS4P-6]
MRTRLTFAATWHLPADPAAVCAEILDVEHWVVWWPQIRAVASLGPDDARVIARSALPHHLDLVLHAVCRDLPELVVGLDGDLVGEARWRLTPVPAGSRLDYHQEVTASGWLGAASRVAAPVMRWNHDRMMAGCVAGLGHRLGP